MKQLKAQFFHLFLRKPGKASKEQQRSRENANLRLKYKLFGYLEDVWTNREH